MSAILTVRLYTELLGPEQVGELSLLLSLTALFTLTLIAPVSSYVMRKAIDWHIEGRMREHLKRPLLYSVVTSSVATALSAALVKMGLLHASGFAGPLVGIAVLGLAVSNAGCQLFNYLGRPFTFVILSCLTSWTAVAVPGLLCTLISPIAELWVLGVALAQLGGGLIAILLLSRTQQLPVLDSRSQPYDSKFNLKAVASYSAPLLIATCFSWIQTDGYRYLFVRIADEHTLGLFVVGFAIGVSPMAVVDRLITDAYLPRLTRDLAIDGRASWASSWNRYAAAAILPLVLFGLFACSGTNLLAKLLVSPTYASLAWLGIWGGLVKALQMMTSLYIGFSYAALDTKHLTGPYLIGALFTLLSMPLLIFEFGGVTGMAASLACGSLSILYSMSRSARTLYDIHFPLRAFCQAVALGTPIVVTNLIVNFTLRKISVLSAVVITGCNLTYIAAVCWRLHPSSGNFDLLQPTPVLPMTANEVEI